MRGGIAPDGVWPRTTGVSREPLGSRTSERLEAPSGDAQSERAAWERARLGDIWLQASELARVTVLKSTMNKTPRP